MFHALNGAFSRRKAVLAECPDQTCRRTGCCHAEVDRGGGRHCKRYYQTRAEWRAEMVAKIEDLNRQGPSLPMPKRKKEDDDDWTVVLTKVLEARKAKIDLHRLHQQKLDYYLAQEFTPFAKGS